MRQKLINYFKASFPAIAIQTTEESRASADIIEAAKETGKKIFTWSATEGMKQIAPDVKDISDSNDLYSALSLKLTEESVYIYRDVQTWPFDRDPLLNRAFRDALIKAPNAGCCLVLVGPSFKGQETFEKLVTVLDYSLPTTNDLIKICEGICKSAKKKFVLNPDVIRALSGLSTSEAENALALSLIEQGSFEPDVIYREKVQAVRKSGLLEIIETDKRGLTAVGGLDNLKEWIIKRRKAYTPEAEKFGLPTPKGILLCGIPGTGKSLSAKAIGTALDVPTVRLDIGALFNSLVGESESRTRDALKLAEAMAPCCLWIDEIDKGFAGTSGGGANDSGVTKRVFGTVISWMQERKRPVFLVATANQVECLPPEFLRKGRFDEIFAVDLPNLNERNTIFHIHIAAKNRKPSNFDIPVLAKASENFTGSEIENVVNEALYNAFEQERDIETRDLLKAIKETTPLAVTAKEQIEAIRIWAKTRARFASKQTDEIETNNQRRIKN
jgi:ATP-dependent 26S proteasome regulatory subunit